MERLTKREGKHTVRVCNEWRRHDPVWDRLASYEDTGLTPEEIKVLQEYHGLHTHEDVEASKEV